LLHAQKQAPYGPISPTLDIAVSTLVAVIGPSAKPMWDWHSQSQMTTPIGRGFLYRTKGFSWICLTTSANNEAGNRAFPKAGFVLYRTDGTANYHWEDLTGQAGH